MTQNKGNEKSTEDLWELWKKDIRPLNHRRVHIPCIVLPKKEKLLETLRSRHETSFLPEMPEISANLPDLRYSHFRPPRHPEPEGKLDLHGMNRRQAWENLYRFLRYHYHQNHRVVLVITGKGTLRDCEKEEGILSSSFALWLNQPPLRAWVQTFRNALPQHGGKGAYYVFFRK